MSVNAIIDGKTLAAQNRTPGYFIRSRTAGNIFGKTASASQWFDVLTIPQFQGAYADSYAGFMSRQAWVRDTIKDIDRKLRNGCILSNTALDNTVAAFKDGHLTRQHVWGNLLAALHNIELVTYKCESVYGKDQSVKQKPAGSWKSYTNEIVLRWKPDLNVGPSEYLIMHELVHKCGFHDALLAHYSHASIESQTDLVASACLP
jgi:hypothetical protein